MEQVYSGNLNGIRDHPGSVQVSAKLILKCIETGHEDVEWV
jgi:hypothetical protein